MKTKCCNFQKQKYWISPELYILIDWEGFKLRGPDPLVVNINIIAITTAMLGKNAKKKIEI